MVRFFKMQCPPAMFKNLCLLTLLSGFWKTSGQVYYSVDPRYLKNKTEQNNLLSAYKYSYPDTSITSLSNYFPRNFMGNTGLPSPRYILTYGTDQTGFRFFEPPLQNDRIKESDVEYYRSKGPYANLTGVTGSKELQIFKMLFTHTYKEKVNITIRFNRYTSKGFYKKQQAYTNNFFLSSNYTTRNKRSGYYLYVLNNGNKNQENGGIRDVRLNDSTMLLNKEILPVNLSSASRDNREFKVMVNPWLRLNKTTDSSHVFNHYLQVKSKFSTASYRYKDQGIAADTFYKALYVDTVMTLDSSHVRQWVNGIDYTLLKADNKAGLSAGYRNEISNVWQKADSLIINHILRADLVLRNSFLRGDSLHKKESSIETGFNIEYIIEGKNKGNYKAETRSAFSFGKHKNVLFLNALYESRNADYIYNYWISNHFVWFNNGYRPQEQLQLKFGLDLGRYFQAYVFYQDINHFLYFDRNALPRQYNGSVNNLGAAFNFTKVFFKHLGISAGYLYQQTSQPAYFRIPPGISTAKLFYHGNLFKNNLQLQIGSQIQLYDSFYGYAYMPSTQVFYLQDRYKTETYPYVDIYLHARIRPVSFFIKVENVLQGFAGGGYSFVPGYIQPDRAFRFGISWAFFD
jgi:hypothetical protein